VVVVVVVLELEAARQDVLDWLVTNVNSGPKGTGT
jgi:hypothetical protein